MIISYVKIENYRNFKDFEILHCVEVVRNVEEGSYHSGEADVVGFVARKISNL